MTDGEQTLRALQAPARSTAAKTGTPAPTQEYLTRHLLESFLDRLGRTSHGDVFVLKGGILLTAYNARRPTKDVDANAINADVTVDQLIRVVHDVAGAVARDGVVFDVTAIEVRAIREDAGYAAYRVRVPASIGPWRGTATWDVSTGDPIVPAPRLVRLERLLGPTLQLLGYSAETAVAEKGVTILERGITSTRWRDYVDIVQLAAHGLDADELRRAAQPLPVTAESPSNPLPRTSPSTDASGRSNGPPGGASTTSKPSPRNSSTHRSSSSLRCSTRPSGTTPRLETLRHRPATRTPGVASKPRVSNTPGTA